MLSVSLDADLRSVLRRLRDEKKLFIPVRDGVGFTNMGAMVRAGASEGKPSSSSHQTMQQGRTAEVYSSVEMEIHP